MFLIYDFNQAYNKQRGWKYRENEFLKNISKIVSSYLLNPLASLKNYFF